MIPTIDLNVYEWMMVRDYIDRKWQKEKVFAVFSDNQQCWGTYNERLDCSGNLYCWNFSRPIEKKILPLESAFDIPSWCFGCLIEMESGEPGGHLSRIKDKNGLITKPMFFTLDYLAENKAYITRDGFGRFNLYREVEG